MIVTSVDADIILLLALQERENSVRANDLQVQAKLDSLLRTLLSLEYEPRGGCPHDGFKISWQALKKKKESVMWARRFSFFSFMKCPHAFFFLY